MKNKYKWRYEQEWTNYVLLHNDFEFHSSKERNDMFSLYQRVSRGSLLRSGRMKRIGLFLKLKDAKKAAKLIIES